MPDYYFGEIILLVKKVMPIHGRSSYNYTKNEKLPKLHTYCNSYSTKQTHIHSMPSTWLLALPLFIPFPPEYNQSSDDI